jgi:spoIIIJ-associated protein
VREGQLDREGLIPEIETYLQELFRAARFKLEARVRERPQSSNEVEGVEIEVELDGPDTDLLLERKAELLLALEHVTLRRLRLGPEPDFHDHSRFDCRNYRADRLAELKLAAETAAERVRQGRTPFRFQPMNARERRILHLALRDQPGVRSESDGERNLRSVVVHPVPEGSRNAG